MDDATMVALLVGVLGFVVGCASLVVTLVLEAANRRERRAAREREDALRARERWGRDKRDAYSTISGRLHGWYDEITARRDRIGFGQALGMDDARQDEDIERDRELWFTSMADAGLVDLLGPKHIRTLVRTTQMALQSYGSTLRDEDAKSGDWSRSQHQVLGNLTAMLDAMRTDLGVEVEEVAAPSQP